MIIKEIAMNASESTKSELNSSNESSASSTTTRTIVKQPSIVGGQTTLSNDQEVLSWHSIMLSNISLGCGAYSKVKEAYDMKTKRKLAIKIIDCLKASKDFQERFLPRELKIWPNLIHPNIIRMHKYLVYGTKIYMILECAELGDMLDYLRNLNRNLAEAECKYWMRQLCSAICYLHNRNIIHRDIKLENLLIDANRCLKLCDFGFTKMLTTTTSTTTNNTDINNNNQSTTTTVVAKVSSKLSEEELSKTYCGSKAYASPEILLGQPYDPRKSDIWAIGCILFILITRKMPFDEELTHQNILKQVSGRKNDLFYFFLRFLYILFKKKTFSFTISKKTKAKINKSFQCDKKV